jgi:hypothetical protein
MKPNLRTATVRSHAGLELAKRIVAGRTKMLMPLLEKLIAGGDVVEESQSQPVRINELGL